MGVIKDVCDLLGKPFWLLAKSRVDKCAQELAVRRFNLKALVRLHVDQYVQAGKIDQGQARGKAEIIADTLLKEIDLTSHGPEEEGTLGRVKDEVTMACVPLSTWVLLSLLLKAGAVSADSYVAVRFRNRRGDTTTALCVVSHIQDAFLFHSALSLDETTPGDKLQAAVSGEISHLLKCTLERDNPEILVSRFSPLPIDVRDI